MRRVVIITMLIVAISLPATAQIVVHDTAVTFRNSVVAVIKELLLNTQREQHGQLRRMARRLSAHTNLNKYAVVDPPRWRTHGGEEFLFSQAYNDALIFGDPTGAAYVNLTQSVVAARDALSRLEVMIMMAGYDIPIRALRTQIASALQLVVQARRLPGGRRKITTVSEISGMEGEQLQMHEIFQFEQTSVDGDGHATGQFVATGIRPRCLQRIEHRGIKLPHELFAPRRFET